MEKSNTLIKYVNLIKLFLSLCSGTWSNKKF